MEQHKKLDYDSDIIICEDIPETISVSTSPETIKKPKTKKHTRKRKKCNNCNQNNSNRKVNFNNNMETLLITQKFKVKTKFKCIINISTVCEKRSDSIVRFHTNVCDKEAYYHRIVPNCLRERCSGDSASCCRSTISRDYNKYFHPKARSLSPVSSLPLTEVFSCNNISYEDVSNGSFSITSDEELDTLIKRTRQREKQIDISHPARKYITSTPLSKDENIASPFSIDTEKTIHSDNTMILNPLPTEAYSPMSSDAIKLDNIDFDDTLNMIDIDVPYSQTMTPDLMKIENLDYSPIDKTSHDDDMPYSPTYTPESIEVLIMDDAEMNSAIDLNQSYSPTFTPDIIEMDNLDKANIEHGNEPYSPTMTPELKMENINNFIDKANENETMNVGCPRYPTVTPDYHKYSMAQTDNWNVFTVPNSTTASGMIKEENADDKFTIFKNTTPRLAILTPNLIKKENENHHGHCYETDYNMNNTNHCKSEKDDHLRGMHDQSNPSETIVKTVKKDRTSDSTVFKNNVYIRT